MKPERIEEILDKRFPSEEPLGMKERVLARAAERRPVRRPAWPVLKLAFAGAVGALILLANVSDNARQARLADGHYGRKAVTAPAGGGLAERMKMTRELLACAGPYDDGRRERKPL